MPDFSKLQAYIDTMHNDWGTPACDVAVYHEGKPVYRYMTGYADDAKTTPVDRDTLYWLYSCSKPITVTAAMQLVERGLLNLDAPVARYLPEYAAAYYIKDGEKTAVGDTLLVRHLFTMTSGLNYNLRTDGIRWAKDTYGEPTTRQIAAGIARTPLDFAPGARFQYGLSHDVLAAVVEVAAGQRFGDYLRDHIFTPLGMHNTGFFLSATQEPHLADQYILNGQTGERQLWAREPAPFRLSAEHESGGAGLFSTTDDYARFAVTMTAGGISPDGVRILRPETVELLRTPQVACAVDGDPHAGTFTCSAGNGYDYGYGVRVLTDRSFGQHSRLGEFGWDGAAGAYVAMDPDAALTVVYIQNMHGWNPIHYGMHNPIRDLSYDALGL